MRVLKKIFFSIIDNALAWFTPSWRREGLAIAAATHRYLRHFEHKLDEEKQAALAAPLKELRAALLDWNKEETLRLSSLLNLRGEGFAGFKRHAIGEMVESLFVIMVVFLGIRTYYAQPFRIPTGSMQPSLNGIIVEHVEETPSLPVRLIQTVTRGSSYIDIKADTPKSIIGLSSQSKWLLFIETIIKFDDGSSASVPTAPGAIITYLKERGKYQPSMHSPVLASFDAGESIIKGRANAGDMIIVNRVAYHFRKPARGESFVFDTRGIQTDGASQSMSDQAGGNHFIKRLVGLPGDSLRIDSPQLIVNGHPASEPSIQRIAARKAPYNSAGYTPVESSPSYPLAPLTQGATFSLANPKDKPLLREYAAMGDNTINSLDSRYWGAVHQFNVMGPAFFALWPFTEHWGPIP